MKENVGGKTKQAFIKQFLDHLTRKKGETLSSSERAEGEEIAEKTWDFSIQNQEVLNGN